ncbi:MAG: hypothetical protein JW839_19380, partial [Candidatus Lokiarchaeota archaeon]|nr:hypothetical protein [Candidatus Lokiarchaeota archaeon]
CKVGVTRYDWISPRDWQSLGQLALNDGSGDTIPSFGLFEWNLWKLHGFWAYKEMLNCIYRYGGHVICPNEWANATPNEGLWIPGDPLPPGSDGEVEDPICIGPDRYCTSGDSPCSSCYLRHGNPQFLAALRDFVAEAQQYERGTCPTRVINKLDIWFYGSYLEAFDFFSNDEGLILMGCCWFACLILFFVAIGVTNKIRWHRPP